MINSWSYAHNQNYNVTGVALLTRLPDEKTRSISSARLFARWKDPHPPTRLARFDASWSLAMPSLRSDCRNTPGVPTTDATSTAVCAQIPAEESLQRCRMCLGDRVEAEAGVKLKGLYTRTLQGVPKWKPI